MSEGTITALIAALAGLFGSVIGSILTLIIGLRNVRLQEKRLTTESKRLKSEIAKLEAEAKKISAEAEDIQRRHFEAERAEIRESLKLFERAAFNENIRNSANVVKMLKAVEQTRIDLQVCGGSLVRNRFIAEKFREIRDIIMQFETEVKTNSPSIREAIKVSLSSESERDIVVSQEDSLQCMALWKGHLKEINDRLEAIHKRFHDIYDSEK